MIKASVITADNVLPRKPLGPNARRAGWQGCYLIFDGAVVQKLL